MLAAAPDGCRHYLAGTNYYQRCSCIQSLPVGENKGKFKASLNSSVVFFPVLTLIWLFHHHPSMHLPVRRILLVAVVVCEVCGVSQ